MENETPSISVIIPAYNAEKTIRRAIESVLAQDLKVLEIIVVDDGSTDATQHLIVSEFPMVRYHRQSNQGVSATRNRGSELAKGEWLAFLDADDLWKPGKLRKQWRILKSHPDAVFITTDRDFFGKEYVYIGRVFRWRFKKLLSHNRVNTSSVLLRRDVFTALGGFDPTLVTGEDWDLWLRIVHRYPAYGTTSRLITRFRVKGSLSENRFRIYHNNIEVLHRWNPTLNPHVLIDYKTYQRIIWRQTFISCLRIHRRDKAKASILWNEFKSKLPYSAIGRQILEKLFKGRG